MQEHTHTPTWVRGVNALHPDCVHCTIMHLLTKKKFMCVCAVAVAHTHSWSRMDHGIFYKTIETHLYMHATTETHLDAEEGSGENPTWWQSHAFPVLSGSGCVLEIDEAGCRARRGLCSRLLFVIAACTLYTVTLRERSVVSNNAAFAAK